MKTVLACLVAATLVGCTIQFGPVAHTKGRVVISSSRAADRSVFVRQRPVLKSTVSHVKPRSAGPVLAQQASLARTLATRPAKALASARLAHKSRARDLSASTDIASMSYTVTNLDPYSGEDPISGPIDPTWPYLDLFLTPGSSYRIVVDVVPTPSAPGAALGVTRYGDQADFFVDYFDDTFVDLFVHATGTPIFRPESYSGGNVTGYFADGTTPVTKNLLPSGLGSSSGDQFVYGPDPKLYYFNQANSEIYQWTDINVTAPVYFSTSVGTVYDTTWSATTTLTSIAAFAVDPYWSSYIYVLASDGATWGIYTIDTSQPSAVAYEWMDVTFDMDNPFTPLGFAAEHPTGLAVDLPGNTFLSFNTYNTTDSYAGVIGYDFFGTYYTSYPFDLDTTFAPAPTYYSDVAVVANAVMVATTPIFTSSYGSAGSPVTQNTGIPQILGFDDFLDLISATFYTGGPTMSSQPGANSLWAPARFEGLGSDGNIYFTQNAWTSTGWTVTPKFSSIPQDLSAVTDH